MVVGADQQVDSLQGVHQVEPLALKLGTVPVAGCGMDRHYDDVRLFLRLDGVDLFLHQRYQVLEGHPVP